MQITKDYLETERAKLVDGQRRSLADANACAGAIGVIDALLARIDKPEPAPAPADDAPATTST